MVAQQSPRTFSDRRRMGFGIAHDRREQLRGTLHTATLLHESGFAWQPTTGGKLGCPQVDSCIFYNRLGLDSVVHAFEQGAPYAPLNHT